MKGGVMLDASAVLAAILDEPGADVVEGLIAVAELSAVNAAEVVGKLIDKGVSPEAAEAILETMMVPATPFAAKVAIRTGRLRADTRHLGLSLGDRACLAQALESGARVLTADRNWARLDIGVDVTVIR